MKNNKIYEIKNLKLDKNSLMLNETIFHNANGYIGIRSSFEEGYKEGIESIRGSYINGFYDIADMKQAERLYGLVEDKQTMLNVVDSQGIDMIIDGEKFTMFEGKILETSRILNMEEGYTLRRIIWQSPKGKKAEITIKRMTSFKRLSLFTIEYSVKALNFYGKINLISTHIGEVTNYSDPNDPRVARDSFNHLIPFENKVEDGCSYLVTKTSRSNLKVCTCVKNVLSKQGVYENKLINHNAIYDAMVNISQDETIKLVKYSIFCDSLRFNDVVLSSKKLMEEALSVDLEMIYKEQIDYLYNYWKKAYIEIEGDEELSLAVNYNLYQLIQSVSKDEFGNIPAKGLSGEGYEGHYFWDTEMYIQPFFILTYPEISKSLIEYRYHILDSARENAKILGHKKGALYPWRTIMGKECSGYFPSGTAQYHISGDIAHSIIDYYLVTKDLDLIEKKGAEILFETARLWMDVGNYYKGKFHINDVTGPDEYTCIVNNNYYTNVCAKHNLLWAVKIYKMLEEKNLIKRVKEKIILNYKEIEEFQRAAENMYIPYDKELRISPQDDSFLKKAMWNIESTPKDKFPLLMHYHPLYLYRHQVCKQPDTVLSHFIFEDEETVDTIMNSFLYYEKITTHDSSLSTCIFSIVASKLKLYDKAFSYFGDSAKLDLFDTHQNTKDGIHTANMGGNYMAIVYGFCGLRIKEKGIFFNPWIPDKWEMYKFKIQFEESLIQIEVRKDKSIFTLLSGKEKKINIFNKEYILNNNIICLKTSE